MNRTDKFISSLEDFELAFLAKYKLNTYLEATRERVLLELEWRNLDMPSRDQLIHAREHNPSNTGCPRCNSQKIRTDQVEFSKNTGSGGFRIAYIGAATASGHDPTIKGTRVVCDVCGFVLKDDERKPSKTREFFTRLLRKLNRKD